MRARDNPFAVHRVLAVRYRLDAAGWEALLARLAALAYRAAIVGPEGAGKTTLLEDLAQRLAARGFAVRAITQRAGERRLSAAHAEALRRLGARDVLLLDGADQLAPAAFRALRRATRGAGGLVLAAHRPGLLPTLRECSTTPELLAGIVRELLGEAAVEGAPCPRELHARHQGNVRTALRELYDLWAARPI